MERQQDAAPPGVTDGQAELLTILEISARLKMKPSFFYAPVRRKGPDAIPSLKVGKYLRYRLHDVMAWIERQQTVEE